MGTMKMPIAKNSCEVETYRNKLVIFLVFDFFFRNMSINDVKSLLQPVIHDSPKLKSDSESSLFDLGSPIKKQMSELVPPASPTLNSEQLSESPPTKMAKRKNFDFSGLGDSEEHMIQAKRRRFQWYVFIY